MANWLRIRTHTLTVNVYDEHRGSIPLAGDVRLTPAYGIQANELALNSIRCVSNIFIGVVAQFGRATACHAVGCGIVPRQPRHLLPLSSNTV